MIAEAGLFIKNREELFKSQISRLFTNPLKSKPLKSKAY